MTMMSNTMLDNDEVADCDAKISMLVAMGFTVESASEALEASSGNIDRAIAYLVAGGGESNKQEKEPLWTTKVNEDKLLPDSITASRRHFKKDDKTGEPQESPDAVIPPRNGRRVSKHVHQFDGIQDATEKPAGKYQISRVIKRTLIASRLTCNSLII
jgi:hypothetical protein